MKRILIALLSTSSLLFSQSSTDKSFDKALENGKFSADLKLFHMTRTFDDVRPDTKALTGGGILKYESGSYHKLKFAFAYYGSHKIGGFYSRSEGIRTSLIQVNGDDIALLGEAYLEYSHGKTSLKVGRQRLDTPLMGDLYLRVVPTAYEAAILKNEDIPKTAIELGYIKSYTGFGSHYSNFNDKHLLWGKDGLAYLYFKNSSLKNLSLRGEYIYALSDKNKNGTKVARKDYRYFDLKYDLPLGDKSYFKAQYGGNAYNDAADSILLGAKVGSTFLGLLETTLFYDKILNNNFIAIMASPMFTDWQQGYGYYEPSSAVGTMLALKPQKNLYLRVVFVDVSSHTQKLIDDYSEFNFTLKYKINAYSKFSIYYSFKDQSDASEKLLQNGEGGREDRNDLRFIYDISF